MNIILHNQSIATATLLSQTNACSANLGTMQQTSLQHDPLAAFSACVPTYEKHRLITAVSQRSMVRAEQVTESILAKQHMSSGFFSITSFIKREAIYSTLSVGTTLFLGLFLTTISTNSPAGHVLWPIYRLFGPSPGYFLLAVLEVTLGISTFLALHQSMDFSKLGGAQEEQKSLHSGESCKQVLPRTTTKS